MINPIKQHYNTNPYPNPKLVLEDNPRNWGDSSIPKEVDYSGKKICIAGTGTTQAVLVHNTCPNADILAMDIAENSLKISQDLCDSLSIKNVKHVLQDFETFHAPKEFDLITSTGVIHHTKDPIKFINNAYESLKDNGIFVGMVYCREGRPDVRELSEFFISQNYDVSMVKQYLIENIPKFAKVHAWDDAEIADVWLNPRFREYTINEFDQVLLASLWRTKKRMLYTNEQKTKLYFRCFK